MTTKKGTKKVKEEVKETKDETVKEDGNFIEYKPEILIINHEPPVWAKHYENVTSKDLIETTDVSELKSIKGVNKTLRGIIYTGIPKYTK